MKVMLDLNIVLDMVQKREPHYKMSAVALSSVVEGRAIGVFPGHGVTTVHYLVSRYSSKKQADELVDWLLNRFEICAAGYREFIRARSLSLADFEDAVVCAIAENLACDAIVTRNLSDFSGSPVKALSPEDFLLELAGQKQFSDQDGLKKLP